MTQEKCYTEADWKLFRKRLPDWQETYMDGLVEEYLELLSGDELSSEKFWKLEKRVKRDKRRKGVIVEMRRSMLHSNVVDLVLEGAIGLEDLEGFSDRFREAVKYSVSVLQRA